jgi:L-malate glycosyltransferase
MKRIIKLTYIVDFMRTVQAGTEKQLSYLLKYLPRNGYSVQLISLQNSTFLQETAPELFQEVEILTLGAKSDISKSLFSILQLIKTLRVQQPDIVHTFFPTSNTFGVLAARLAGIQCVISSRRDMGFNLTSRDICLLRVANFFVSRVICNARAVRDNAIRLEKLEKTKSVVIYNGIAPEKNIEAGAISSSGVPIIGIVANLNRDVKRVDIFVRAAGIILKSYPRAMFWIIGEGHLRDRLENLARKMAIENHMVFFGRRADTIHLVRRMSVGVICSESEGLSNAIMEYMAAGIPVVATDSGGTSEIVQDGITGFLIPPGDEKALAKAIENLLDNPETSFRMGHAGYEMIARHFSISKMLEATTSVYQNLLKP